MSATLVSDAVVAAVLRRRPMHRRFLKSALANLTSDEVAEAERYMSFFLSEGETIDSLTEAYLLIVEDTFRETVRFKKTGRYRFSTFAEAQAAVYDNADYMHGYMTGLAISSFWWLNHVRLRRFFTDQLRTLSALGGLYREVGPGHGIYFIDALRSGAFDAYEGVDVSSTSIALTGRLLSANENRDLPPARLIHADFLLAKDLQPANVLVMGEVLEHVESPSKFLTRSYETTTPNGRVYLTTCIDAPAIDHLYNPASILALETLFNDHGFGVVARCELGQDGLPLEDCARDRLTINVGYVLAKLAAL